MNIYFRLQRDTLAPEAKRFARLNKEQWNTRKLTPVCLEEDNKRWRKEGKRRQTGKTVETKPNKETVKMLTKKEERRKERRVMQILLIEENETEGR